MKVINRRDVCENMDDNESRDTRSSRELGKVEKHAIAGCQQEQ
jgi:hypothetical protein